MPDQMNGLQIFFLFHRLPFILLIVRASFSNYLISSLAENLPLTILTIFLTEAFILVCFSCSVTVPWKKRIFSSCFLERILKDYILKNGLVSQ